MSRRHMLHTAGGSVAAAWWASLWDRRLVAAQPEKTPPAWPDDVTGKVARYMAGARERELPAAVVREAKHRILDTIAAIVSGSRLKPGEMTLRFVRAQGGTPEASILATPVRTSAVNAALANAMFAHADETDDADPVTKSHPGAAVVPAALAVGERDDRSGVELVRAVALGYDLAIRWLRALGPAHVRATHRSAEAVASTFGGVGGAASMARLDEKGMRYALSYAAQQDSGVWSWERDLEHVEKAFDFAGMGARNGVTAALMAQMGLTGVASVLDGEHNALQAYSAEPHPEEMFKALGERFFVTETTIKTYSVGLPVQAPLDAFFALRREHALTPDNVSRIVIRLPEDGAKIVDDRSMPDVNCQYLMAVALIDGDLSFEASHSYERMKDPRVAAVKKRIELVADRALMDPSAPRSGRVEVTMRDGRTVSHFTRHPPGSLESPLDTAAVAAKARALLSPILGASKTEAVIQRVAELERVRSVREVAALLVVQRQA